MSDRGKYSYELRLAYGAVLCFIVAQYVVSDRPWNQIFRVVGLLLFLASMILAARKRARA